MPCSVRSKKNSTLHPDDQGRKEEVERGGEQRLTKVENAELLNVYGPHTTTTFIYSTVPSTTHNSRQIVPLHKSKLNVSYLVFTQKP